MKAIESAMEQRRYEELARSAVLWDEKVAKEWINDDYGFEYSRIRILDTAAVYEEEQLNGGAKRFRKCAYTADRMPYYDATDWNYCRFTVAGTGMTWEIINGELNWPVMTDYPEKM